MRAIIFGTGINAPKNWTTIIVENCNSEAEAFDKFMSCLKSFEREKEKNKIAIITSYIELNTIHYMAI